jgi:carbon-monoxide dehydrogenase small subunit
MDLEERAAADEQTLRTERAIAVTVNGQRFERAVPVRKSLVDFVREDLQLTGSHVGCEHGVCGACTVLLDDQPVRGCLVLAVQADGKQVTTVEGLADEDGELHPIQRAFWEQHGLQCGFCTPGFLLTTYDFLRENKGAGDGEIREALSGNICRCTGYQGIVRAVQAADRDWER